MRLLLISDLAATGFGRVGRELATRLMAMGWDTRIIGINWRGVNGELHDAAGRGTFLEQSERMERRMAEMKADPLTDYIMPASVAGDGMGHNLTGPALNGGVWKDWKPEAVIVVADPRAMWLRLVNDNGSIRDAVARGIPVFNYVPIEGAGLPNAWLTLWNSVTPVAMSLFGQRQLELLLGRRVAVAFHGVSDAFRPLSAAEHGSFNDKVVTSKDGAKTAIGHAGRTIILRADRYIFRKNYPAWFRILRPVLAAHPEAIAIAHTTPVDDTGQGNIWELISREPGAFHTGFSEQGDAIWEHPQIRVTGWHNSFRGLTDEELRVLYCAADVIVSPTMAEGFGLTLAEAMACGVPVVATDYSAVTEVVGPGGILIPTTGTITNAYAHEWALVDEPAMSAAVERLVSKPAQRASYGVDGRRHVAQYSWATTAEIFDRLLRRAAAVAA